MPRSWSIRHYLIALTLAMALPLVGLLSYSFHTNYRAALEAAGRGTQRIAEIAAADIHRFTKDAHQFLYGLAQRPQTRLVDATRCDSILPDIKAFFPQFANIAVLDREGQMICSALNPSATKLPNLGAAKWVKEARERNEFNIGAAHLGPVSKKWVVVFSEPIRDSDGRYNGLIGYSLDLASFPMLVSDSGALSAGTSLVVVDADDVVIMRSSGAKERIGDRHANAELMRHSQSGKPGYLLTGDGPDDRLLAYAPIADTQWRIIADRPAAGILDGLWLTANRQYIGASLLILLGSLLAAYVARHIARPVQQIARTARRVAEGDLDQRAAVGGFKEIVSVATHFNTMLDVRLKTEAKYRNLLETASDAIIVVEKSGAIVLANHRAEYCFGYSKDELIGKSVHDLVPLDVRDKHAELVSSYVAQPVPKITGRIVRGVRQDGSVFPCDISLSPLQTEDGLVVSAIIRDLSERTELEEQLAFLSQHDPLTGLPNRALLRDRLDQAVARAGRSQGRIALIHIDIDRFAEVNDFHGTAYADTVLVEFARSLRQCLRDIDTVVRSGSDEFIVIIEDENAELVVQNLIERLRSLLSSQTSAGSLPVDLTVSGGVAAYPCEGGVDGLLKNADLALGYARMGGGNSFRFFEAEMDVRASQRLRILSHLRGALARGELTLNYQPKIDNVSGAPLGVEALLRWTNAELGAVSPAEFIPLAEESGLIEEIGVWVLRTACQQGAAWRSEGLPPLSIAVNLSARQFGQSDLLALIESALVESGLPAEALELEITEGMLMDDPEAASVVLRRLSDRGIRIAIDDFGTGYSSLSYLRRFPVNVLKVDQSFVRELPDNVDDASIVEAIVSLAHSLRLEVVAEGVETDAQRQFLGGIGVRQSQGYFFCRPLPAEQTRAFLRSAVAKSSA